MSKSILRNYLEYDKRGRNKKQFDYLSTGCFLYEGKYLVSDSCSIVALNDTRGLEVKEDLLGINLHYKSMQENKVTFTELNTRLIKEDKREAIPLDIDNYELNVKLAQRVIKLIKANKVEVLKDTIYDYAHPIIKISNDKTGEIGLLLPMKKY